VSTTETNACLVDVDEEDFRAFVEVVKRAAGWAVDTKATSALSVQGRRSGKQELVCRAVHAQRGVDLRRRDADAG
jgi:hypothetical protein